MQEQITRQPVPETDILERAVLFVVNLVSKNFKKFLLAGLIGGVLGTAVSFFYPKQYKAQAQLLPEFKESSFSNFGSLASLAGIDLSSSNESDALRPDLYPNILQSTPAAIYLLKQPVKTSDKKQYASLLSYLTRENKDTMTLQEIVSEHEKGQILNFNLGEIRILNDLKGRIETNFDKKSGVIHLGVEMADPIVSATVLSNAINYLNTFVSDYRFQKKHNQSEFIRSRVQEAESQLKRSEYALQKYRDNNRNVFLNVAKIEEQKLQADYLHAQTLRSDLLNQLEQAILAEKERQPIIEVLEPPVVPAKKSSPVRIIFAVAGAFLTLLVSVIIISIKNR